MLLPWAPPSPRDFPWTHWEPYCERSSFLWRFRTHKPLLDVVSQCSHADSVLVSSMLKCQSKASIYFLAHNV